MNKSLKGLLASLEDLSVDTPVFDETPETENETEVNITVNAGGSEVGGADLLDGDTPQEEEQLADALEAGEEVEEAAGEAVEVAEASEVALDKNAEFVNEVEQAVAAGNDEEAIEIIEASNEVIANILGTNALRVTTPSLESVNSPRARRIYLEASLESIKDRAKDIVNRVIEFFKKIGNAIAKFFKKIWSYLGGTEKRSNYLIKELEAIKDKDRTYQIESKSLAARLVVGEEKEPKSNVSKEILDTYKKLKSGIATASQATNNLYKAIEEVINGTLTEEKLYEEFKFASNNIELSWLGGYVAKMSTKTGKVEDVEYEFKRVSYQGGEKTISLPSPKTTISLLKEGIKYREEITKTVDETLKKYGKHSRWTATKENKTEGFFAKQSFLSKLFAFHKKMAVRPMMDYAKVLVATQKTGIAVAVAVLSKANGKEVDDKKLDSSKESLAEVISGSDVEKYRSESPEDTIYTPSATGNTEDEDLDIEDQVDRSGRSVRGVALIESEQEDTNAVVMAQEVDQLAVAVEEFDELSDVAHDQEQLQEVVEEAESEGGLDQVGAELMQNSLESIDRRLAKFGIVLNSSVPALESFGGVMSRRMATSISAEGIKERAKSLWETIRSLATRLWNWIKKVANKVWAMLGSNKSKVKGMLARLDSNNAIQNPEPMKNPAVIDTVVNSKGKSDADAINTAIGVTAVTVSLALEAINEVSKDLENIKSSKRTDHQKAGAKAASIFKNKQEGEFYGLGRTFFTFSDDVIEAKVKEVKLPEEIPSLNISGARAVLETINKSLLNEDGIKKDRASFNEAEKAIEGMLNINDLKAIGEDNVGNFTQSVRTGIKQLNQLMTEVIKIRSSKTNNVLKFVAHSISGKKVK